MKTMTSFLVKNYRLILAVLLGVLFYYHLTEIRYELKLLDGLYIESEISNQQSVESGWGELRHSINMNLNVLFAILAMLVAVLNLRESKSNKALKKDTDNDSAS